MIDVTFDVRSDANGKDPDTYSPTLRRYHQLLWSKPLPSGRTLDLRVDTPGTYLHHRSHLGEFWLSSDSVIPTYTGWPAMASIVSQLSHEEHDTFFTAGYTIGGIMVFPAQRIGGKQTLNGARGFHPRIKDRMDLTLECIRRHYMGEPSPLGEVVARYEDFFSLFVDFRGYVDFFLLQDLVTDDYSVVRFFLPFQEFDPPAAPTDIDSYREYRRRSMDFIAGRNARITALDV